MHQKGMTQMKRDRYWTVVEAAIHFKVSVATIRRLIAAGKIRALRIGRSIRIDQEGLARGLMGGGAR
jgi:excisionase family DNA binding protein